MQLSFAQPLDDGGDDQDSQHVPGTPPSQPRRVAAAEPLRSPAVSGASAGAGATAAAAASDGATRKRKRTDGHSMDDAISVDSHSTVATTDKGRGGQQDQPPSKRACHRQSTSSTPTHLALSIRIPDDDEDEEVIATKPRQQQPSHGRAEETPATLAYEAYDDNNGGSSGGDALGPAAAAAASTSVPWPSNSNHTAVASAAVPAPGAGASSAPLLSVDEAERTKRTETKTEVAAPRGPVIDLQREARRAAITDKLAFRGIQANWRSCSREDLGRIRQSLAGFPEAEWTNLAAYVHYTQGFQELEKVVCHLVRCEQGVDKVASEYMAMSLHGSILDLAEKILTRIDLQPTSGRHALSDAQVEITTALEQALSHFTAAHKELSV